MTKSKNKFSRGWSVMLALLVFGCIGLLIATLMQDTDLALLNPKGLIAQEQLNLMLFSVGVMLVVAIPTLILLYSFAWKYRDTNEKAVYSPNARHGKFFVFNLWALPTAFMLILAFTMWPATHRLAPQKAIAGDAEPITIQVVALRWKWLFIYPEQNIASVNFVQIPLDTPVQFELTADEAPMSSFWIPHLGGQLYAMTGHRNMLSLMAETPGDYPGSSAEINGAGFAGMKFITRASTKADFDLWVQDVRSTSDELDQDMYLSLLEPSENNAVTHYSSASSELYDNVLMKYRDPSGHSTLNDNGDESH